MGSPAQPNGTDAPPSNPIYNLPLRCHLRETRIMYLESGTWDDSISCRLEVAALGIQPEYEALSYVWGPSQELRVININGHTMEVGVNLWSALRHIRSKREDRPLWADAICIDQNNIEERNEQVALMRDIYSQCSGVIIWLGDADASAQAHLQPRTWRTDFTQPSPCESPTPLHIDDAAKLATFHAEVSHYYRLPFALRQSLHIDHLTGALTLITQLAQDKHVTSEAIPVLANPDSLHKTALALHDLMTRPWWTRQWVVQEVVLPPRAAVHVGGAIVPWPTLAAAARNYDRHRKLCCQGHYARLRGDDIRTLELFARTVVELDDLRRAWQGILLGPPAAEDEDEEYGGGIEGAALTAPKPARISLRQLLWRFRARETSDPRDKVFALFPLVNDWGKHVAMYPEYGWSAQAVYRAVAEKIITVDESLLVLSGSTDKTLPGLPSWVPDWTGPPARFELERLGRTRLFRAFGPKRRAEVRFLDKEVVEVQGVLFDVVDAVAEVMAYDDEEETLETFASWYRFVCGQQAGDGDYVAGGSRVEAYWRTLCMDTCRSLARSDGGNTNATMGEDREPRYRRCSPEYVRDCMALWMDSEGLPHAAAPSPTCPTPFSDGDEPQPRLASSELTKHDDLNFVAIDFAITSATMQRRLFATRNGYIGLGPPAVRPGDPIHVFAGGHTPFIVRDAESRHVRYVGSRVCSQLIGDCYVHGIMDGEAMGRPGATTEKVYLI